MLKQIIINADDFGFCQSVNKAIVEAHTTGVLTSATIMANMPAVDEAIGIAKKNPTLGVGVHLNVTQGMPLSNDSAVKCITSQTGNFKYRAGKLAVMATISGKIRNAIETEFAAQIS